MAAGLEDYEIKTEQTFVDAVLGILTGGIITARTVTVTK
jgi:hypoxanthine phosphoribosyltransferase